MSSLSNTSQNVAVGRRLAAVRSTTSMSQGEFAATLNMSPRAYFNYERGEREIPSALLVALYRGYHVDPLWVLLGPGDGPLYAGRRPDPMLVRDVVHAVEGWLIRKRKKIAPEKKAMLVQHLYERFLASGDVEDKVLETLVALAA